MMTTEVFVINRGPNHVLVRTFLKDNEPGDNGFNISSSKFIRPGEFFSFYVHGNQGLLVDEEKQPFNPDLEEVIKESLRQK